MEPMLPAVQIRELQWKIRLILTSRASIAVEEGSSVSALWLLMTAISFHFKDSTKAFERTAEDNILDQE